MTASVRYSSVGNLDGNPFLPGNGPAYSAWREAKLRDYPSDVADLMVSIADPARLADDECVAALDVCRKTNMVLYDLGRHSAADKGSIRRLGEQFGLVRLDTNLYADDDSITSLQVTAAPRQREYIPYTSQRLNWHTDGYYNAADRKIRGFLMHCVADAVSGGDNRFLDHEIAYLLLRDASTRHITALMQPDAMTIPANVENGVEIRGAETGPVFSVEPETGNLYMRYSARTRNIVWKDDADTRAAVAFLQDLWANGCPWMYHHRLVPGQGIICNNILHHRSAFEDASEGGRSRLLYRARYHDRIRGTDLSDCHG